MTGSVAQAHAEVGLGAAGIGYVATLGLLLPLAAWLSKRAHDGGAEVGSRHALFVSIALQQLVLAGLSWVAIHFERLTLPAAVAPSVPGWIAAGVFLLGALFVARARWRLSSPERRARQLQFVPGRGSELPPWFVACALAGFSEELAYRGVLPGLLGRLGAAPLAAILLSAAAFALAHAVQGWVNAAIVFGVALGFHAVVELSGSLVPAIFAHAVFDAGVGVLYLRWSQDGVTTAPPAATPGDPPGSRAPPGSSGRPTT